MDNGLLNLISVSENDQACERAAELPARTFDAVLFTFNTPSMLTINTENEILKIASGSNEALYFVRQHE